MTRLAVLADIHGNLPALEAVVDDLAQRAVDQVVVAGDVIHWGPFSAQVVQRILDEGWAVIRGNAEYYLLDYGTPRAPAAWSNPAQFGGLAWLHRQLAGPLQTRIAAWPDTLHLRYPDAPPVLVVHGSPRGNREAIQATTANDDLAVMLAGVTEPTVIAAHTHRALDRRVGRSPSAQGGWHLLNPGTVGQPLDGRHEASYLLLDSQGDGWRPTFRRVHVDPTPLFAEFERQRYLEQWGPLGRLAIEEFRTARPQVGPFLRWHAIHDPDAPITADLIDAFVRRRADEA